MAAANRRGTFLTSLGERSGAARRDLHEPLNLVPFDAWAVFLGRARGGRRRHRSPQRHQLRACRQPGNAPYTGGSTNSFAYGRGQVVPSYNIGKMEVTTSQWVDFMNAAFESASRRSSFRISGFFRRVNGERWVPRPPTPGDSGRRSRPGEGNYPVGNISWYMAAMYCDWLCNGKNTTRSAFLNGAYDVSTFINPGQRPVAHTPGAQCWIPPLMSRSRPCTYDPNKNGPGQGGYWLCRPRATRPRSTRPPACW